MTDKPLLKERELQIMDEIRESVSQDFKIRKVQKSASTNAGNELPCLQLLKQVCLIRQHNAGKYLSFQENICFLHL